MLDLLRVPTVLGDVLMLKLLTIMIRLATRQNERDLLSINMISAGVALRKYTSSSEASLCCKDVGPYLCLDLDIGKWIEWGVLLHPSRVVLTRKDGIQLDEMGIKSTVLL